MRPTLERWLFAAAVGLAASQSPLAWSASKDAASSQRLKALERAGSESRARAQALAQRTAQLEREMEAQRVKLTAAAAAVRAAEEALSGLEAGKVSLAERQTLVSNRLAHDRATLGRLEAALVGVARTPTGALLIRPEAPIDAARAQMLLDYAWQAFLDSDRRAAGEMAQLDAGARELEAKRGQAEAAAEKLRQRQAALAALIDKRQALYQQTEEDRRQEEERAQKLAAEASDLRDLMARIESEEEAEAAKRTARRAKPALSSEEFDPAVGLPVAGALKSRFGQSDGLGAQSHGVTIVTRPGATVTAPAAGIVRFAGPFRGYREILIIEHPEGYLSLLAGMARINIALGASLGAGEPIGTMDARPEARPELYYELRKNGQFVDPQTVTLPIDVRGKVR